MNQPALELQFPTQRGWTDSPHRAMSLAIPEQAIDHGEVFTRRWIVDLILDLAGYTRERDLATLRAVEPSCGSGAFLGPIIERLSASLKTHKRTLDQATDALRAYDLLERNVRLSRTLVVDVLTADGHDREQAARFAEKVVSRDDYLLRDREHDSADFVLGNPPYIRLEDIPAARTAAYREACPTMGGRADIYVGFMEVGLSSLKPGGVLGFIVADRWMHNAYGAKLRKLVTSGYSIDVTVQMHDVDAFEEQVSAYPAISILRRSKQGKSVVADTTKRFGATDATELLAWTRSGRRKAIKNDHFEVDSLPHWFEGESLWPSGSPAIIRLIEDLNDRFQPLEDKSTNTRVSIGVATGADQVSVTKDKDAAEPERMLPLSMAADTNTGTLWDLKVLGGLLFSRVAEATVEAYCVKMRGGTLRFQAQYLRQIRVPRPQDISDKDSAALSDAFEQRDADAATEVALRVYGLPDLVMTARSSA